MRLEPLTIAGVVLVFVLAGIVPAAVAAPITYTEQATATGSLGGSIFTNALVTLQLTGDTTAVVGSVSFFENAGPATVTVAGIGTAAFTDATEAFASVSPPRAAIVDVDQSLAFILAVEDAVFASYDLTTSLGPVVGSSVFNPGLAFPTALGDFILTAVGDVTFTATTATPVSWPASLLLPGVALAAFAGWTRRRSSQGLRVGARVEENRHRPVVHEAHVHLGAKAPGGDDESALA